jgi:N-acetylglutamate synthase-like GNAT family acetyltransferase
MSVAELRARARERGWSEDLVDRALAIRVPKDSLQNWLQQPWTTQEFAELRMKWHERMTFGTLRGREATARDNDAMSELWANSPENIGDYEVITERSPDAFAQFRLQDRVSVLVLEEEGKLIACCAFAPHNVLVAGKPMSVHYGQALRVHKDYRRQGYGDQVRSMGWAISVARPTMTQYDYMRSQNFAVVNWWKKYSPDFFEGIPEREGDVPGISVTVQQYPARPFEGDATGIRKATVEDLPRCVELINRTNDGLDLWRPQSVERLSDKLSEGIWGERPPGFPGQMHVYGWDEFYVLEENGSVVACAGLWDRGRDIRDRWRHKESGEEKVIEVTCVLDFGFADERERSMARLIEFLIGVTATLGRDYLTVPLDWLPALAEQLGPLEPVPETRALRWGLREPEITKPYTDLVYW